MKLPEKFKLATDMFLKKTVVLKDTLIMAIWLYGSAARGDVSERHSDIDFLVLLDGLRKKTGDNIQKIAAEVTAESKVNVHVEIMDYHILKGEDEALLQTVAKEGDLLYSSGRFYLTAEGLLTKDNKLQRKGLGLKPYYFIEFRSTSIPKSKQPALFRAFYGGTSSYRNKEGKTIKKSYPGSKKIIKMGRGAFLVGVDDLKDLETVLRAMSVEYHINRIVWI